MLYLVAMQGHASLFSFSDKEQINETKESKDVKKELSQVEIEDKLFELNRDGKYQEYIKYVEDLISVRFKYDAIMHLNLARMYFDLKNYERALDVADKALILNNESLETLNLKLKILYIQKKFDQVLELIQSKPNVLVLNDTNVKIKILSYYEKGDYKNALKFLSENQGNYRTTLEWWRFEMLLNYKVDPKNTLFKILKIADSSESKWYEIYADFLFERGEYLKSNEYYHMAQSRDFVNPLLLNKIGISNLALNRPELAKNAFKASLKIEPDNTETRKLLAKVYLSLKLYLQTKELLIKPVNEEEKEMFSYASKELDNALNDPNYANRVISQSKVQAGTILIAMPDVSALYNKEIMLEKDKARVVEAKLDILERVEQRKEIKRINFWGGLSSNNYDLSGSGLTADIKYINAIHFHFDIEKNVNFMPWNLVSKLDYRVMNFTNISGVTPTSLSINNYAVAVGAKRKNQRFDTTILLKYTKLNAPITTPKILISEHSSYMLGVQLNKEIELREKLVMIPSISLDYGLLNNVGNTTNGKIKLKYETELSTDFAYKLKNNLRLFTGLHLNYASTSFNSSSSRGTSNAVESNLSMLIPLGMNWDF